MAEKSSDIFQSVLGVVFAIYSVISQIMAVYFWWQYAKEDSFLATITIDIILAELKGILWIFFVW